MKKIHVILLAMVLYIASLWGLNELSYGTSFLSETCATIFNVIIFLTFAIAVVLILIAIFNSIKSIKSINK